MRIVCPPHKSNLGTLQKIIEGEIGRALLRVRGKRGKGCEDMDRLRFQVNRVSSIRGARVRKLEGKLWGCIVLVIAHLGGEREP